MFFIQFSRRIGLDFGFLRHRPHSLAQAVHELIIVVQAGLKIMAVLLPHLPSAGIIGLHYYTQLAYTSVGF